MIRPDITIGPAERQAALLGRPKPSCGKGLGQSRGFIVIFGKAVVSCQIARSGGPSGYVSPAIVPSERRTRLAKSTWIRPP